ncbi:MAG: acyl-[acyl-carrier-protein]--UDP-N-acetylglucosamine O-acyltransferase [Candidatus Muiribacterium halophilum]|uniref:Acyl-[acyl-carrier-protein]--UDP-N-acetylglucosamine O-acyltransferase n=1 Tax=Muiribacterium halophilum TaxID=2053465 RepID=A0A2N5ZJB3_MUIH1|nr:MAG: acyl-[acyl-carrier-protein]--UDP-N-acetylglucosamine O-acyltransferase [Candidatus Muirbacterium halophilum]
MNNNIDKRAIVCEGAVIGEGSIIEPNAYIGSNVIIGKNCKVMSNAYITGNTIIGDNNNIFPGAVIGTITQAIAYAGGESGVVIGNNNNIREFVTINATEGDRSDYTRIGDNNLIMAYAHMAHHTVVHNNVVLSNNATLAGHVTVDNNAIIGGLAAVHQFVRIGRFSMTGGKSKIIKDVLPYVKVDGNPSRVFALNIIGFERNGFSEDKIENLKKIFRILFRSGYNVSQALEQMKTMRCDESDEIIKFIKDSERGILFKRNRKS